MLVDIAIIFVEIASKMLSNLSCLKSPSHKQLKTETVHQRFIKMAIFLDCIFFKNQIKT